MVLLGTIMTILDATIVNIAIPTLQVDLKAGSYADISWVVTGYMLAQGAVIPMAGWATDRFGTKRLYLITIALFTLASMACGIATNLPELVVFRVLQGLGGGMLMPIGMTIIMRAVGPQNMGRVMGIFGIPMLLAPGCRTGARRMVRPGFLVAPHLLRQRPDRPDRIRLGVAVPHRVERAHGLRLDTFGLLTAPPAAVAVMYAVNESITLGWTSLLVISLLVGAAVLLTAFVLSQLGRRRAATLLMIPLAAGALLIALRNGFVDGWTAMDTIIMFVGAALAIVNLVIGNRGNPEPLLQLRLFRDSTFSWSMGLSFIIVTALFGGMLLLPLYLQEVHGYSPLETGLLLLPQAITAAVAMPLGGYLTDRIGPRPVVATGMVMLAGGGFLLAQIHPTSSNWLVVGALLLRGFAMGFSMMPSMAAAMARVPHQPELECIEHLQQPATHRIIDRHRGAGDRARGAVHDGDRTGVVRAVRSGAERRVGARSSADHRGVLRHAANAILEAHPERWTAHHDCSGSSGGRELRPHLCRGRAQHVVRSNLRVHHDPDAPGCHPGAVPAPAREGRDRPGEHGATRCRVRSWSSAAPTSSGRPSLRPRSRRVTTSRSFTADRPARRRTEFA